MGLLVLQSGCGTIGSLAGSPSRLSTKVYSGVRADLTALSGSCGGIFAMLDLPLSFAADTILLPFFLVAELFTPEGPPPPEESGEATSPSP